MPLKGLALLSVVNVSESSSMIKVADVIYSMTLMLALIDI
jgi:hypothetical protein